MLRNHCFFETIKSDIGQPNAASGSVKEAYGQGFTLTYTLPVPLQLVHWVAPLPLHSLQEIRREELPPQYPHIWTLAPLHLGHAW
jgi:hypothetical protein